MKLPGGGGAQWHPPSRPGTRGLLYMELDVRKGAEEIASGLENQYKQNIGKLDAQIADAQAKMKAIEEKRKAVLPELEKRRATAEVFAARTKNAFTRYAKSKSISDGVQKRVSELTNSIEEGKVVYRQLTEIVTKVTAEKSKLATETGSDPMSNYQRIATMVKAVSSMIDTTQPVIFAPRKFAWTTAPIQIKDTDGVNLPFNFGRFKVELGIKDNGLLQKKMTALEPSLRGGCPHPHVSGEIPCLGNADNMVLEALREGEIGHAIHIVHEHLTHYNPGSPHSYLRNWVASKYDIPMCHCGLVLATQCGCDVCPECAKLLDGTMATESTHSCGFCAGCCRNQHKQSETARTNKAGIKGSACLPIKAWDSRGNNVYMR